jgi:phage shock protein E
MQLKKIFLLAIVFTLLNCNMQTLKNVRVIEAHEFKKEIFVKNIQLIDVRTAAEYKQGAIANAKNFDFYQSNFKEKIKTLDKTKPVYLYCKSGGRSKSASQVFENEGFKQIIDLKGGYDNWK